MWYVDPLLDNDRETSNIQQPLLSNDSANNHVSVPTREYNSNGRDVLYAARVEML
jgi:hypothetical protein